MSAYRVGLALATSEVDIHNGPVVGTEGKKDSPVGILVALGLVVFAYVAIPGKKGWQRAMGKGQ